MNFKEIKQKVKEAFNFKPEVKKLTPLEFLIKTREKNKPKTFGINDLAGMKNPNFLIRKLQKSPFLVLGIFLYIVLCIVNHIATLLMLFGIIS